MKIIDLPDDDAIIQQTGEILYVGFKEHWPDAWPTRESAEAEVRDSLKDKRISRIAVDEIGIPAGPHTAWNKVLGWIGAIPQCWEPGEIQDCTAGVWELHPLVVSPRHQGRGIGRALVADLEEQVRAREGRVLYLGTDDEDEMTSIGGIDLYPDPLEHLRKINNLRNHPYEFYQRLGFAIVGVMPDASGRGKPDIQMAKRLS